MPGALSIYIARRFTATLLLILFGVASVLFLAAYVDTLVHFTDEEGFSALLGLRLALMRVPYMMELVLPFVFLFGALISLIGLSRSLELVVARASGVSVWGFMRAPFVVALLFGVLATAVLNPVAVALRDHGANMEAELSGKPDWTRDGQWFRQEGRDGPSIVYASSADFTRLVLFGVTAFVFDKEGHFHEKVTAPRAEYHGDEWVLGDAVVVSASMAPHNVPTYRLPTSMDAAQMRRSFIQPEAISVWALPEFIRTAERMGLAPARFQVQLHELICRPVFLLAMVMIAATVGLRFGRDGGLWRLALTGAAAGFLLYAFSEILSDLGSNGIINPVLAAWLPPIVVLTFGATALLFQEDG